jgi:HK97 family phage portal protein
VKASDGTYLDDDEIDQLVDDYVRSRQRTGVGFLQSADLETYGWSARELQLVEGRQHLATELARMVGLPADAIDAPSGDAMTYANRVERRRELVEALRPWLTVIEQTLSQDIVTRHGQAVRFDVDPYIRDDPATRAVIWGQLVGAGILTVDEVRAIEPFAPADTSPEPAAELALRERDAHRGQLMREAKR